jgi:predicted phosphoribosyltransferase
MALFRDRVDAGQRLAAKLAAYAGRPGVIVLGLPRGGVPVAEQVALALGADLDAFVVRKIGVPGQEELAMGAVATGGVSVVNQEVVDRLAISDEMLQRAAQEEMREVEAREREYRDERRPLDLGGKLVILVDDGLATGASMHAAVEAARMHGAARVIVAVPVAPPSSCEELRAIADAVICATTPERFSSVGEWYDDFSQITDDEVREALARHRRPEEWLEPAAPVIS